MKDHEVIVCLSYFYDIASSTKVKT